MRAKIRQLFCLIVIVIIVLAIGAAAINVYMVWGTKGRILKKDQWANFKADGVVVLGCAVRPYKEASPMLNDRMQTAISFYKEASAKKMLVSGDNLNEDYDEVSVMKKLAVSGGIEADEVYMDHTGLNTYDTIVNSLEFYKEKELQTIIIRSAGVLDVEIDEKGALEMARRSRGTPRLANRLLKRVRDFAQVKYEGVITEEVARQALDLLDVDRLGLDHVDRNLLTTMIEKFQGGPVGLDTLAAAIGEDAGTVEDVYEPYLLKNGFLQRTPRGRVVTDLAYTHLGFDKNKE